MKNVHGRLTLWLDLLAQYKFKTTYRSGTSNCATGFLYYNSHMEEAMVMGKDYDWLALITIDKNWEMKPLLLDFERHLYGENICE